MRRDAERHAVLTALAGRDLRVDRQLEAIGAFAGVAKHHARARDLGAGLVAHHDQRLHRALLQLGGKIVAGAPNAKLPRPPGTV
jgi:hypothetical protein